MHVTKHSATQYGAIFVRALKRFYKGKRLLWATSLTYTTIFSLIPLLSVVFFLFKLFGGLAEFKTLVEPYIYKTLAPGAQAKVLTSINDLVSRLDFHTIGVLGSSVLVISVFLLLFEMEYALNEIWLIRHNMSILSRAAIYWTAITIGPLVLAGTLFSIAALQNFQAFKLLETYIRIDISPWLLFGIIGVVCSSIYLCMPGTKVRLRSAMLGGICTALFWKIAGLGFSLYMSGISYYPKVYGSLAAIPLFLLWLFLCWILFLLGAEISYVHQNFTTNNIDADDLDCSTRDRICLALMLSVARACSENNTHITRSQLAERAHLPKTIVDSLLAQLITHGLIIESSGADPALVPGQPLPDITVADVLAAAHRRPDQPARLPVLDDDLLCERAIESLYRKAPGSPGAKSLQDLLLEQNGSV